MKQEIVIPIIVAFASAVMFFVIFWIDTETEINPAGISVNTGTVNTWTINTGSTENTPAVIQKEEKPCYAYQSEEKDTFDMKKQPYLDGDYTYNTNVMLWHMKKNGIKLSHDMYSISVSAHTLEVGDKILVYSNNKSYIFKLEQYMIERDGMTSYDYFYTSLRETGYYDFYTKKHLYGDISQSFKKWQYISVFLINTRWESIDQVYLYYNEKCMANIDENI